MTQGIGVVGLYVHNQDEAVDFYVNKLGFQIHADARNGGYRWLTVKHPNQPTFELGLFLPQEPGDLVHAGGTRFRTPREPQPMEGGAIFQGFLEGSNVNAVSEITRMIEVQRAYEMGQGFLEAEDGRIRSVTETLGR